MKITITVCIVCANIDEEKADKQCLDETYYELVDLEKAIRTLEKEIRNNNTYVLEHTALCGYWIEVDGIEIVEEQQYTNLDYLKKYEDIIKNEELIELYKENKALNLQILLSNYDKWDKTTTYKDYIIKLQEDKPHLFID